MFLDFIFENFETDTYFTNFRTNLLSAAQLYGFRHGRGIQVGRRR